MGRARFEEKQRARAEARAELLAKADAEAGTDAGAAEGEAPAMLTGMQRFQVPAAYRPASRLPVDAAAKLRRFYADRDDAALVSTAAFTARQEAQKRHGQAQVRVKLLRAEGAGEGHPSVITARGELALEADKLARAIERSDAASHRSRLARALAEAIERWIENVPADASIVGCRVAPKVPKGVAAVEAIEMARAEVATLKADLHAVRSAPMKASAVKARSREQIDALAAQGEPGIVHLFDGGEITWPQDFHRGHVIAPTPDGVHVERVPASTALVAWLHRDSLVARLDAEIDMLADDTNALSDDERASRIGKLSAAMLEAERREESLIELAESQSTQVPRRPDADPRALLCIAVN